MAAPPRSGALAGLRAGAMAGAATVAVTLGVMVALLLLGGGSLEHDLIDARWVHQAVIAAGIGAAVGVVLGGAVGAILGRAGKAPIVAATLAGAFALASAAGFYLVRLHASPRDIATIVAGAASAGAAIGIVVWLPVAAIHGVRGLLHR